MEIPAPSELILILLIVVVVFGPKKIPEIMEGVAKGIKSFKEGIDPTDKPRNGTSAQRLGSSSLEEPPTGLSSGAKTDAKP